MCHDGTLSSLSWLYHKNRAWVLIFQKLFWTAHCQDYCGLQLQADQWLWNLHACWGANILNVFWLGLPSVDSLTSNNSWLIKISSLRFKTTFFLKHQDSPLFSWFPISHLAWKYMSCEGYFKTKQKKKAFQNTGCLCLLSIMRACWVSAGLIQLLLVGIIT